MLLGVSTKLSAGETHQSWACGGGGRVVILELGSATFGRGGGKKMTKFCNGAQTLMITELLQLSWKTQDGWMTRALKEKHS